MYQEDLEGEEIQELIANLEEPRRSRIGNMCTLVSQIEHADMSRRVAHLTIGALVGVVCLCFWNIYRGIGESMACGVIAIVGVTCLLLHGCIAEQDKLGDTALEKLNEAANAPHGAADAVWLSRWHRKIRRMFRRAEQLKQRKQIAIA